MKKYVIFLFAAIFVFSVSVNAQGKKGNKGIEKKVEKMVTDLGLNDTEKASVTTLFEKQAGEVKALKEGADTESAEFKAKMQDLRKTQEAELKSVIGNEKYAKLKEIRAAEKAKKEAQ